MNELKEIIKEIEDKRNKLLKSNISKKIKLEYLNKYNSLLLKYYAKYIENK